MKLIDFDFNLASRRLEMLTAFLLHSDPADVVVVVNFLGLLGVLPDWGLEVLPGFDLVEGLDVLGLGRDLQF